MNNLKTLQENLNKIHYRWSISFCAIYRLSKFKIFSYFDRFYEVDGFRFNSSFVSRIKQTYQQNHQQTFFFANAPSIRVRLIFYVSKASSFSDSNPHLTSNVIYHTSLRFFFSLHSQKMKKLFISILIMSTTVQI